MKRSPRRSTRPDNPPPDLLLQLSRNAMTPRICVKCQKKFENAPDHNPHKVYCSSRDRMWCWRRGVDAAFLVAIRLEVELLERQFEKDLAAHREKLRNGGMA